MVSLSPVLCSAVKSKTKENPSTIRIFVSYFPSVNTSIAFAFAECNRQEKSSVKCKAALAISPSPCADYSLNTLQAQGGGDGTRIASKGWKRFFHYNSNLLIDIFQTFLHGL